MRALNRETWGCLENFSGNAETQELVSAFGCVYWG